MAGNGKDFRGNAARRKQLEPVMDQYQLTNEDGHWVLTHSREEAPVAAFTTKAEAVLHSVQMLKERVATLTIHREDGTVEEERVFPESSAGHGVSRPMLDDDILADELVPVTPAGHGAPGI